MTLFRRSTFRGVKRNRRAVCGVLHVLTLLCLGTIGLGASLEISAALICGGESCGEETEGDVEVSTDWQHRVRLRNRIKRTVSHEAARPCRVVLRDRATAPTWVDKQAWSHLTGAGIRILC